MSDQEPFDPYRLARRREARSSGLRRRRRGALMALGLAAVFAAALIAVLASSGGGAPKRGPAGASVTALRVHHRADGDSGSGTRPPGAGAPTRHGPPGTAAVPILMYHVINAPPRRRPFPWPLRGAERIRRADAGAPRSGLSRGHDGPAARVLARRRAAAAGQADRALLRQRLPIAVHARAARPAPLWLGGRREPPAQRTAALAGGHERSPDPAASSPRAGSSTRRATATPNSRPSRRARCITR